MHFAKPSVVIGALFLLAGMALAGGAQAQTREAARNSERTLVSGGLTREYILHLPKNAPPGPLPLVIALHGALQPAGMMQRYLDLDAVADREGFAVAYPKGLNLLWNDGRSSIAGFIPLLYKRDDGRFVVDLLDKLAAQGIADPSRAYLMGFSNGGFLTAYVACRFAERFQAYATMMMTVPVGYSDSCRPSKPVPILLMNGTYDPIVPMFGRPTPGARLMSADATAALFARLDGCAKPEVASAPHARITRWTRCAPGGEVAYYEVAGGHQPPSQSTDAVDALASVLLGPRRSGLDAPQEIWSFFKRYGGPSAAPEALVARAAPLAPAPPAAPKPVAALALASTTGGTSAPLSGPAPILRNPESPATAWQGIAPPAGTQIVAAQATVPALHKPLAIGAPMPLQADFVRADTAPPNAAAPATLARVPLPPPSPLRRRSASAQ
ncbi:prolyl oligopeptidase family serine peptidase [Starkeya koreensis]|uniref:Prolyl oligopeptidase family serine peptidase n=1 Tax=Ancylobacter koreensis TaxID=266121 RepID=A0ABT0DKN1_9HYPH|nr:PHB depolymerase family esterase [Ancylobacter koreensis]MCK0207835.1 prolyl oligopeptidase family serine peptidase [Ancylobacter koreensis]